MIKTRRINIRHVMRHNKFIISIMEEKIKEEEDDREIQIWKI